MGHAQLMEHEFEQNMCSELAERGWIYDNAGSTHAAGWDVELALVPGDVITWLSTQYPEEYAKAVPEDLIGEQRRDAERKLLRHLTRELAKNTRLDPRKGTALGGLLGVLRSGFKYAQVGRAAAKFGPLMVVPPENPDLTDVIEASDAVRLRVLRQVRFDTTSNETIDVVLTVNGIPVVTMELKTDNTQSVAHAVRQYRTDRRPNSNRPLLAPGRALVHFAVSNDEVHMTTKLNGEDTVFLPFNQGNEGHQGNPPSQTGSSTNYLWRTVLARPMFMRILRSYAIFEPGDNGRKGTLIFPRFHQLRAVEKIVDDVEQQGTGGRYLIWHSAGSGKTKTIAWLSHRLIRHVGAVARPTFDSVIVVTDRVVLDRNVNDDMLLIPSSDGLVVAIGEKSGAKSPRVKAALLEGNHIITCTLQTFPEVMKLIEDTSELRDRRWVIVADEAHSSQTGSDARSLKALLSGVDLSGGEDITTDDLLAAEDSAIAQSANITFVALTATPKAKTLRLFGRQNEDGDWTAFDTYTMAQAIEEGFILDVLSNYSTYDMFVHVKDELGEEQTVDTAKAVTDIVRFARLHPTSIAQKVRVVVEHFRRNVIHALDGQAKAMVVTSSRIEALRWSEKMNAYIAKKNYGEEMRTLVAFSGSLTDEAGETVTEVSANGVSDTAGTFEDNDVYKVLIVANKFQTGFDEPRLMAMYVDKKLSGIATVQTLSRLNRCYPGKTAPMVLDFRNTPESIQADFKTYYSDAHVHGDVDPNALYTLADKLDTAGMYSTEDMEALAEAYVSDAGGETLAKLLSPIKNRWQGQWAQARISKDKVKMDTLKEFRSNVISYRNAWQFLSQIVDYQDVDLHKRAILTSLLARNLHADANPYDDSYMEGIELTGVQLRPSAINEDHSLTEGDPSPMELPGFDGDSKGEATSPQGPLAEAIEKVNEMFRAKNVDVAPGTIAGFVTVFWGNLEEDRSAKEMAKNNSVDQLKTSGAFQGAVGSAMFKTFQQTREMQAQLTDPEFLGGLTGIAAEEMHEQVNQDPDS